MTTALAAFGLIADADVPLDLEDTFALWPDCVETFNFWQKIQTQWTRHPMGELSSLFYPGVEVCMNMFCIKKKDRPQLFSELQAMESAVLKAVTKT